MPTKKKPKPVPRVGSIYGDTFQVTLPNGEKFHLGYSRLSKYVECPRAYKFSYIDKIRLPAGVPLRRGSAYHNTVEKMLLFKMEHNDLMPTSRADKIALKMALAEELTESECHRTIDAVRFYHSTIYNEHSPIAVEQEFDILRGGVRLTGRIDLVENHGTVVDHKFSYDTWAESRAKFGVQPIIYQWAAIDQLEQKFEGWKYTGFEYNVIRLFPSPKIQRIKIGVQSQDKSDWWEEQIFEWSKAIRRGIFPAYPKDKTCGFCDFKELCQPTIYRVSMTDFGIKEDNLDMENL